MKIIRAGYIAALINFLISMSIGANGWNDTAEGFLFVGGTLLTISSIGLFIHKMKTKAD